MRTYWDSSAIINAAVSQDVLSRLDSGDHFTRLHSFAEFFATMTGRGIPISDGQGNLDRLKFTQNECAAWLRSFADKVKIVEPNKEETLDALEKTQSQSVQGGRVYDYIHALASTKARADELLTRNTDDFQGLANNVCWP